MTSLGNGTYCTTLECQNLNVDEINRLNTIGNLTFTKDNETKWSLGMTPNNDLVLQNEVADVGASLTANFDTGHVTILGGGSGGVDNLIDLSDVNTTGIQNNDMMIYDSGVFRFSSDLSVNDISANHIDVGRISASISFSSSAVVCPLYFSNADNSLGIQLVNNTLRTVDQFGNYNYDLIIESDLSLNGYLSAKDASFQNVSANNIDVGRISVGLHGVDSSMVTTDVTICPLYFSSLDLLSTGIELSNNMIRIVDHAGNAQDVDLIIDSDLSLNGHLSAIDASFHTLDICNVTINNDLIVGGNITTHLLHASQINTHAVAIPDTSHYNVLKSFVPNPLGVFSILAGSIDTEVVSNTKRMHLTTSGIGVTNGLTITSEGHVGIGIQNPTVELEVDGDISLNGDIHATDSHSTNAYATQLHANVLTTNTATSLKIFSDEASPSNLGIDISQNIISGCNQSSQSGLPVIIGQDLSVNGNVEVYGNTFATVCVAETGLFSDLTTGSLQVSPGNVGIGIVPSEKLDVNGNIKVNDKIYGTNNHLDIYPNTDANDSVSFLELRTSRMALGGPNLEFYSGSTTTSAGSVKMIINNTGDVGIGTTNPSEKLEVDGNLRVSGTIRGVAGTVCKIHILTWTASETFFVNSTSWTNVIQKSFTKTSGTYLLGEAKYEFVINGFGTDTFQSRLVFGGSAYELGEKFSLNYRNSYKCRRRRAQVKWIYRCFCIFSSIWRR